MGARYATKAWAPIAVAVAVAAAMVGAALLYALQPWAPGAADAGVSPKPSLSDYSWDELSRIAGEIGSASDEGEAFGLAAKYGLCDEGGAIAQEGKAIRIADGPVVEAKVVGIWQDERADGGKAGLTFMFSAPAGEHGMNHAFESPDYEDADSVGGWGSSDMRLWLNGSLFYRLPADLRGHIAPVQKRSASLADVRDELSEAGRLAGSASDWALETTDALWLFSASELCGEIPPRADFGIDSTMSSVYAAEGGQYRAFTDAGVSAFTPNAVLVREDGDAPITWWLRTKTLEFGEGFWLVGTDGAVLDGLGEDARIALDPEYAPDELWGPDHARGVVAGFCL